MAQPYSGKQVWIIGASSGIGEALARELATQGARLVLSARRQDRLDDLNQSLGGNHRVMPLDAGDSGAVAAAAQSIAANGEPLHSMVFMAAFYSPDPASNSDIDFVNRILRVNLGGAFNAVFAVTDLFRRQGFGQIALCASVAGYRGLPYGQPYCATKAALINYAESLKIELEDDGIDVKVINPGFVKTPLTDKNQFTMPMIIAADKAARILARELLSRRFEIHFPKGFTWFMKLIDVLPRWAYFPLARLMKKAQPQ